MPHNAEGAVKILRMKATYENRIAEHQAKKRAITEKIERLQQAHRELSQAIEDFTRYCSEVKQSAVRLNGGMFKGDRRKKYEEAVARLSEELQKERKEHQKNVDRVSERIRALEIEKSGVGDLIAGVQAAIGALSQGLA